MPSITVSGSVIHYQEQGDSAGRPLVLLHGFPLDSRMWADQLAGLSDKFRVIAPDLPGFGKSPESGPFTIDSMADRVNEFLQAVKATPCVLAGFSMGGYIALAYCRKCPMQLRSLILIDTRAEGDPPEGKQARMKMIEMIKSAGGSKAAAGAMLPKMLTAETMQRRPELVGKVSQVMESQHPLTIERALLALRDREDYTSFLPSIANPALILVGDNDTITPRKMSEAMQRAIPKSELVIIKDAAHLSPMEQPQQVNQAIRRFMDSLPL